eukprot:1948912-Amphidinium_carterae.2
MALLAPKCPHPHPGQVSSYCRQALCASILAWITHSENNVASSKDTYCNTSVHAKALALVTVSGALAKGLRVV